MCGWARSKTACSVSARKKKRKSGDCLGTGGSALLLLGRGDPGKAAAAPSPATSCGLGAQNCICFVFLQFEGRVCNATGASWSPRRWPGANQYPCESSKTRRGGVGSSARHCTPYLPPSQHQVGRFPGPGAALETFRGRFPASSAPSTAVMLFFHHFPCCCACLAASSCEPARGRQRGMASRRGTRGSDEKNARNEPFGRMVLPLGRGTAEACYFCDPPLLVLAGDCP